ncbi:uncharacterized protein LOC119669662 [Teleopsis dalmanni]|uniref:uncharacterized protein LOC119669662 n=1 Tax=Teleopsis dalmanni TaxID=139649 RepID=UPI0018CD7AF2|nr:uncharacterized protein LOC119669662 [Teleopsis dalmanni]
MHILWQALVLGIAACVVVTTVVRHWNMNSIEYDTGSQDTYYRDYDEREEKRFRAKPGDRCSICLEPMADLQMSHLKCGHALHSNCLRECRRHGTNKCPSCNKAM